MKFYGWVEPTQQQLADVLNALPQPIFRDCSFGIKNSGAGKRVLLSNYVYTLLGNYIAQIQAIGDCFVASTKVTMYDGTYKNIEDISIDDIVLSSNNKPCKVLNTIRKQYSKPLYEIKLRGHHTSVICTEDHKFLCSARKKRNNTEDVFWVEAKNLDIKKHYVITPYGYQSNINQYVEFNNTKIEVDSDFAYLLGVYLAEGGCSGATLADNSFSWHKVTFNLCLDEEVLAEQILSILAKLGIEGKKYYHKADQNVLLVEVHNHLFAKLIKKLIPGNVYDKSVPIEVLNSSKLSRLACLKGWMVGDGYTKNNRSTGTSSSSNLITSLATLALSCELVGNVRTRRKAAHQRVAAQDLEFCGNESTVFGINERKTRKLNNKNSIGVLRRIKQISKIDNITTNVFCLEVEDDHSFIADGFAVHNCASFGSAHAVDYTYCTDIVYRGSNYEFLAMTATEDIYGGSRVQVGKGQLGSQDGSIGAWCAQYVSEHGTLIRQKYEYDDLTIYDSNRARQWGMPRQGVPSYLLDIAHEHRIQTVSLIKTYEEARDSLANGYAITVASNQGFSNVRDKDGFLRPQGNWGHMMCLIGVDDNRSRPGVLCLNSWPYEWVSGPSLEGMPPGSFWIDAQVLEDRMLRVNDSWAYSDRIGFEPKELDWKIV